MTMTSALIPPPPAPRGCSRCAPAPVRGPRRAARAARAWPAATLRRERRAQDRQLRRVVAARERLVRHGQRRTVVGGQRTEQLGRDPRLVAGDGDHRPVLERGDQAAQADATAPPARSTRARRAPAAPCPASPPPPPPTPPRARRPAGDRSAARRAAAPSPSSRPSGGRGRPRAPPRSRADGVGAQQLAQLDLQLQRRERRLEALVGARRARVAPGVLVARPAAPSSRA